MKRLKFVFLTVFILCLASCEKELANNNIEDENPLKLKLLTKVENDNLIHSTSSIQPRSFNYESALNALLEFDAEYPFIEAMLDQLGSPYWDGMYSVSDPEETFEVFFVPLIKTDSERIGGFIQFADHNHEEFYHLNVIPSVYTMQLDASLDENFVAHAITNVAFDGVLFDNPDPDQLDWLLKNYKVNLDKEGLIEKRTVEISYSLIVGHSDATNWSFPNNWGNNAPHMVSYVPTTIVLSCNDSEDDIFFDPDENNNNNNNSDGNNNSGGGNNSILNPPFLSIINLLQTDCDGETSDGDGAGTDTNSETETTNLSATEQMMLDAWCNYKNKCLSDDLSGVQPLNIPIAYNTGFATNPYYLWSQLMYNVGTEEFLNAMNYGYGCAITDEIELIECISEKYDNFIETYNLDLTAAEEKAIKKAAMDSEECGEIHCILVEKYGDKYIETIENTNDCTEKYIEDLNNIFQSTNCNLVNFSSVYRDYFGITESTEEQTVPTIGIGDILCENMFTVTSVEDGLHVSAGISALNFQVVNSDGVTLSVSHPYLQIMIAENLGTCALDYTHESLMAEAVNAAIGKVVDLMEDYESYSGLNNSLDFGDNSIVDDAFQKLLQQSINEIYYNCNASPSSGPLLSNSTEWGDKCHTIYNQLSEININDCN